MFCPKCSRFRLSSCCGCLSLKSGTIFCGICCIILAIIAIVLLFVTHIQWKTIIINTNDEIVKIIYTINLVMTILISILLIIGAVKKNTYIMLPWVILGILLLIALLVSVLYTSAAYFLNDEEVYRLLYGILSLVFGLITFIGYSYCWFVVHSYYQQLRLEKTSLSVGPYGRPYSYQRP